MFVLRGRIFCFCCFFVFDSVLLPFWCLFAVISWKIIFVQSSNTSDQKKIREFKMLALNSFKFNQNKLQTLPQRLKQNRVKMLEITSSQKHFVDQPSNNLSSLNSNKWIKAITTRITEIDIAPLTVLSCKLFCSFVGLVWLTSNHMFVSGNF